MSGDGRLDRTRREVEPVGQMPVLEHPHQGPVRSADGEEIHDDGLERKQDRAEEQEQQEVVCGDDEHHGARRVIAHQAEEVEVEGGVAGDEKARLPARVLSAGSSAPGFGPSRCRQGEGCARPGVRCGGPPSGSARHRSPVGARLATWPPASGTGPGGWMDSGRRSSPPAETSGCAASHRLRPYSSAIRGAASGDPAPTRGRRGCASCPVRKTRGA